MGPSLAAFDGRLYMAWPGANTSQGIYWATFDGVNWSAQHRVAGVGTSNGPSLAVFNGRLYMAWTGAGFDNDIYWNYRESNEWIAQQKVGRGAATRGRPSLAVSHDRLYLAWKAVAYCCEGSPTVRSANPTAMYWASSR
jgi:hypothetical protein